MNNYELANQEACKYDGVLLRDSDEGEIWHCVGLLIAADDIYYEVIRQSDRKRRLMSFVGDLEGYGFMPAVNEQEKTMTRPTEQQLNDPKWWDENAPFGATHINVFDAGSKWWRKRDGCVYEFKSAEWSERLIWPESLSPRPTNPVWSGDGLPPVGCECEYRARGGSLNNGPYIEWRRCKILAVTKLYAIMRLIEPGVSSDHECSVSLSRADFRPLRTPEQRQRDELIQTILAVGNQSEGVLADTLIAAGWRKGSA